jgi:hypothetical protein
MSRLQVKRRGVDARCVFCGEDDPVVLDCHRLKPGSQGGRYSWANTITVCSNDHRRIHAGKILVHGRRLCTSGWVLHWSDTAGEHFSPIT